MNMSSQLIFGRRFLLLFQIVIIEHKSIICPGYNAVLHIHTCIEEVQISVSYCSTFETVAETFYDIGVCFCYVFYLLSQ